MTKNNTLKPVIVTYLTIFLAQFLVIVFIAVLTLTPLVSFDFSGVFGSWPLWIQLLCGPAFCAPVFWIIRTRLNWVPTSKCVALVCLAQVLYFVPAIAIAAMDGTSMIGAVLITFVLVGNGWSVLLATGAFIFKDKVNASPRHLNDVSERQHPL